MKFFLLLLVSTGCLISDSMCKKQHRGHAHANNAAVDPKQHRARHDHAAADTAANQAGTGRHQHQGNHILAGYKEIVSQLLEQNIDIDAQNEKGDTVMMTAVNHGLFPLVDEFLKLNASLAIKNNKGLTPLMVVDHKSIKVNAKSRKAGKHHEEWIELAKTFRKIQYPELNCPEHKDYDLRESAKLGQMEHLSLLLACGVNPNGEHKHHSVLFESVKSLLSPNTTKSFVMPVIKKLLEYGAKVNLKHQGDGNTVHHILPLVTSVTGDDEVLKLILDHDATGINSRNNDGSTPLMIASSIGAIKVVEELVAREASLDSQNKLGRTAIMQAVAQAPASSGSIADLKNGKREVLKLLLASNAHTNYRDKKGKTALELAVENSADPQLHTILLEHITNKMLKKIALTPSF